MVLVAVRGGMDSMYLAEKVRLEGGPFAIAHCNFQLRGADSDADEELVRSWAVSHGIPCHIRRFDTTVFAGGKGISIEMAARELRYRWFGELCREHGYEAVLTAHHAGDNAETFFLNLLRGTGIRGLCGMAEESFLPVPEYGDIPLRRPILGITRAEIAAFLKERQIPWREDRTNAENTYKRNKLRNQVFPLLREINPAFEKTLASDMARLRSVSDIADDFYREYRSVVSDGSHIDTALLRTLPHWEYLLYRLLEEDGCPPSDIEKAVAIVRSGESGRQAGVWFSSAGQLVREDHTPLRYAIREESWDGTEPLIQKEGVLILDADKVRGTLEESHWVKGDWFRPLGMRGRKKLQDWFTDRHFSIVDKHRTVLLRDSGHPDPHHVVAIAGYAVDDFYKVTSATRRIFRILPIR